MTKWGIICPGPSLDLYKTIKILYSDNPGFLIAVNGAFLLDLPFSYWAVQDIEVFETVYNKRQNPYQHVYIHLWHPNRWITDIPRDFPTLEPFYNNFILKPFPSATVSDFNLSMPFGRHINWREYTVFMAIALAIKEGAQTIYLYGAGMSGTGYCVKDLENCRTQHTERRWKDEAEKLSQIIQLSSQNDIAIIRRRTNA